MRRALLFSLMMFSVSAVADWDPALEAEEAAARAASARAAAKQKAEADRIMAESRAKFRAQDLADKRKHLGAEASGLSDGEVERRYDQKVKRDTANALAVSKEGLEKMGSPDVSAKMKAATGKSMGEIMNMSEAEQEAWAAEMERSMGAFEGMEE